MTSTGHYSKKIWTNKESHYLYKSNTRKHGIPDYAAGQILANLDTVILHTLQFETETSLLN